MKINVTYIPSIYEAVWLRGPIAGHYSISAWDWQRLQDRWEKEYTWFNRQMINRYGPKWDETDD